MKTRQSKKGEYHSLLVRIPIGLWETIQAKSDSEHKSYASIIVEILRIALKDKTQ